MEETAGRWSFHRQAAEDERAGRKAHILLFAFAVLANHLYGVDLPETPLGNDEIGQLLSEQVARASVLRFWCDGPL